MCALAPAPARCKDRLPELRRRAGIGDPPAAPDLPHPPPLATVLHEIERVREWVAAVRVGTARARALLAAPTFHADVGLQEELDAAVTRAQAAGLKACGALRQLEAAGGAGGAAGRVARTAARGWRGALHAALHAHHQLLDAARCHQLQLLHHHAHLVNAELSAEECEALLDAPAAAALFVDNVVSETAGARLALREAEARRAELARVEAALEDVRALFAQLGALVAAQQDALDSVEHTALRAARYVDTGQGDLLRGSVTRRKTRKKKMGLIICLSAGVLLVLLVLIFT